MKLGIWPKIGLAVICVPLFGALLLICAGILGTNRIRVGWKLLTGWWDFLGRNWPQVTVNWTLITTGILCSVAVLFLVHRLCGWIFRHLRAGHGSEGVRAWRWGWTISIYCGVWLLFAIAFGTSGVFRHGAWLLNNQKPLYEVRKNSMADLKEAVLEMRMLVDENSEELTLTRKAFLQNTNLPTRKPTWENYNVLFYGDKAGKVAAFVVIPREWSRRSGTAQFAMFKISEQDHYMAVSNLPVCLEDLEKKYGTRK